MARKPRAKTNKDIVLPGKIGSKVRPTLPGRNTNPGTAIPNDASPTSINQSIQDFRAMSSAVALLRRLAEQEGAFSFAVFSYIQTAMSDYDITAYNVQTGEFDSQGTQLAAQVTSRLDTLHDYTVGFSDKKPLDALVETMLKDAALSGAVAGELILDKQKLPERIETVAYESLKWVVKKDGVYPQQQGAGDPIDLDIPNFFVAEMGKGSDKAYSSSFMLAAIKQIFYYAEFIEDMRTVVRRSGHPRMVFKLNYQMVANSAPADVRQDSDKMKAYLDRTREELSKSLDDLNPEDTVVVYDFVEVEGFSSKGEKADYKQILEAIQSMVATSIKTHPSILGLRLGGSQSLSNTESLIFIKSARALQKPVEVFMSRALTLATRMYGSDVYVRFKFRPIDLRPEQELESFRTQRQQNVMQALSLGWISDDEASHILGYGPRVEGAPDMAGTLFYKGGDAAEAAAKASPNADPMGRSLQPDTPQHAGGDSQ